MKSKTPVVTRGKSSAKNQKLYVSSITTDMGDIGIASTDKGVCLITLPGEKNRLQRELASPRWKDFEIVASGKHNAPAAKQLQEYLQGKRRTFDFKIDLHATGFKRKALIEGVKRIPYGRTKTYGDVARAIGSPRAFRAVGNANATNPLPIVIPCHRVVATSGLGGYGGGLPMKRRLLDLEGASY